MAFRWDESNRLYFLKRSASNKMAAPMNESKKEIKKMAKKLSKLRQSLNEKESVICLNTSSKVCVLMVSS